MEAINKKADVINLFTFLAVAFVFILMIGTFLYAFGLINTSLSGGNIIAGQQNISNDSANTFGQVNTAFLNSADLIGVLFLFGMVISMFLVAYFTRGQLPRIFLVWDIILLVFAYIAAVYISNSYETILTSFPFINLIASNLNNSSRIMLLLPRITVITGILVMIITYAGIPRSSEEEVPGF